MILHVSNPNVSQNETPMEASMPSLPVLKSTSFTISMSEVERDESLHLWRNMYHLKKRSLNRAKLKQASSISAFMAGFALVALVEMDLYPLVPSGLLLFFGVTSTILVGVHMIALMISTCILPHFDAFVAVEDQAWCLATQRSQNLDAELYAFGSNGDLNHSGLSTYIEIAWSCSTLVGIFLFVIELGSILWIKFYDARIVAIVGTSLLVPILLALAFFVARFYKLLMTMRFESAHREIDHLHRTMVAKLSRQQL